METRVNVTNAGSVDILFSCDNLIEAENWILRFPREWVENPVDIYENGVHQSTRFLSHIHIVEHVGRFYIVASQGDYWRLSVTKPLSYKRMRVVKSFQRVILTDTGVGIHPRPALITVLNSGDKPRKNFLNMLKTKSK